MTYKLFILQNTPAALCIDIVTTSIQETADMVKAHYESLGYVVTVQKSFW